MADFKSSGSTPDVLELEDLLNQFGLSKTERSLPLVGTPVESIAPSIPIPAKVEAEQAIVSRPNVEKKAQKQEIVDQSVVDESGEIEPGVVESDKLSQLEFDKLRGNEDKELQAAKNKDRILKLIEGLDKSFSNMSAANPHANVKAVDSGINYASTAEKDLRAQRGLDTEAARKKKAQELQELYQQAQMKRMGELGELQKEELGLKKEDLAVRRGERKEYMDQRKDQQDALNDDRGFRRVERLQTQFQGAVKKEKEALDSARLAEELLNSNTPISDQAIKRSLARLAGEVGVLTDRDVKDFGGSTAVRDRMEQSIKQMYDGTLTAKNKEFMRQMVDKFKAVRNQNIQNRAQDYAKQASKRFGMPVEEMYDYLLPGEALPVAKSSQGDFVTMKAPNGQTAKVKRSEMQKYLDKGAEVVGE